MSLHLMSSNLQRNAINVDYWVQAGLQIKMHGLPHADQDGSIILNCSIR